MDIWAWVESTQESLSAKGEHRLASLFSEVPHFVVENEHERAETLVPEGIALARKNKLPWAELFFRHWRLQSRILHRQEVKGNLDEAVSLLDFAHHDDTKECPQAICAVQDLANCYGHTDGPGYVEERLAVARESLERITPAWPCFHCISGELIDALMDGGRNEEALSYIQDAAARRTAMGEDGEGDFALNKADVLLQLGRYPEALRITESAHNPAGGEDYIEQRDLTRAMLLAKLERYEEAEQAIPPFDRILRTASHYREWLKLAEILAVHGQWPNDEELNIRVSHMAARLQRQGCLREGFAARQTQANLALGRNMPVIAALALQQMQQLVPQLAKPLDAPAIIEELNQRLAPALKQQSQELERFADTSQLLQWLEAEDETLSRSEKVSTLWLAQQRWPTDVDLIEALGSALAENQWLDAAIELLAAAREQQPENINLLMLWGFALLDDEQYEPLQQAAESGLLAADNSADGGAGWHWLSAQLQYRQGNAAESIVHLDALLEVQPEARMALGMRAHLQQQVGDLSAALADLDALAASGEAHDGDHWDRLTLATRLQRWSQVRDIAEQLNIELTRTLHRDDPVEEDWEHVELQFTDSEGNDLTLVAERTGPVTARILQIPASILPWQLHDIVVFNPAPLNMAPDEQATDEEKQQHRFEYQFVDMLQASGMRSFEIDGAHPGDTGLAELRQQLSDLDCPFTMISGDEYEFYIGDELCAGLYARLAIPEQLPAATVNALLARLFEANIQPLAWTQLALAADDQPRAAQHSEWADEYGLDA